MYYDERSSQSQLISYCIVCIGVSNTSPSKTTPPFVKTWNLLAHCLSSHVLLFLNDFTVVFQLTTTAEELFCRIFLSGWFCVLKLLLYQKDIKSFVQSGKVKPNFGKITLRHMYFQWNQNRQCFKMILRDVFYDIFNRVG